MNYVIADYLYSLSLSRSVTLMEELDTTKVLKSVVLRVRVKSLSSSRMLSSMVVKLKQPLAVVGSMEISITPRLLSNERGGWVDYVIMSGEG